MIATAIRKYTVRGIPAPRVITSEAQNEQYIATLLEMERRGHLTMAEKNWMELLTVLVEAYEEKQYLIRAASPVEVLQELMTANDLKQKDLAPQFGSESVVSEVLGGTRPFNVHHIKRLSERFHVSPEVFFPAVTAQRPAPHRPAYQAHSVKQRFAAASTTLGRAKDCVSPRLSTSFRGKAAKKFSPQRDKMSPESRERARTKARAMLRRAK